MECDRCVDRRGPRRDRAQLHYLKLRKTRGLREHVPGHLSKRIKASFEQVVTGRLMTAFGRKAERPQITWPFGMIIFPEVFDITCSEWLMMTSEYELCAIALRFCAAPSFQPIDY